MGWALYPIALSVVGHINSLHTGVSCTRYVACERRVRGRDRYLPSSPPRLGVAPRPELPAARQERLAGEAARGRGSPYVVGKKVSDHHVLRPDLRPIVVDLAA